MTNIVSPKDLTLDQFSARIATEGLGFAVGPFSIHIRAQVPSLYASLHLLYADIPFIDRDNVFTLHAGVSTRRRFPRLYRSLAHFTVDGYPPHGDLPVAQALPVLEWGINLVIAMRSHHLFMLHAAVLEKGGLALVLPGTPGSGKSTLAAALAHSGWRLFSDEFGLVTRGSADFLPVPRPIALKNESIEVFGSRFPDAVLGPRIPETRKGTVAHVRPPAECVSRQSEQARARWVVFPRWRAGSKLEWSRLQDPQGFMGLATNAFNYELLGERGFDAVKKIIDASECYSLVYSDLDEAMGWLDDLAESDGPA